MSIGVNMLTLAHVHFLKNLCVRCCGACGGRPAKVLFKCSFR